MTSGSFQLAVLGVVVCMVAFGAPESQATDSNELDSEGRSGGAGPAPALNPPALPGFGAEGLGSMLKSMTELGSFVNSFSSPKKASTSPESGESKERPKEGTGFLGMNGPMDFFKLMLNPMEFMNRIAKQFKLDRNEFTQSVGRGMNFGLETALQPPMVCIKIIEKVFVPDACRLKFVCDMGHQMTMFKGQMPKFPDSFFEGASTAKALYDGATGRECEHVYDCKNGEGPTLKKEYANLKGKSGSEQGGEGEQYAASQQSWSAQVAPNA